MAQEPEPTYPKVQSLSELKQRVDGLRKGAEKIIAEVRQKMLEITGLKIVEESKTVIIFTFCGRKFAVRCVWGGIGTGGMVHWYELVREEDLVTLESCNFDKLGNLIKGRRDLVNRVR